MTEPKTGRGRSIHLSQDCIDSLRHRQVLEAQERLKMGPVWEDNDLVFPNVVGKPYEATNLMRRSFQPLLEKAAVPKIRFHDLRHTCATLLLGRGVHVKIVSEMLGHSDVGTTLNIYSHALPTMQEHAADVMHSIFGPARMMDPENRPQPLTHRLN